MDLSGRGARWEELLNQTHKATPYKKLGIAAGVRGDTESGGSFRDAKMSGLLSRASCTSNISGIKGMKKDLRGPMAVIAFSWPLVATGDCVLFLCFVSVLVTPWP